MDVYLCVDIYKCWRGVCVYARARVINFRDELFLGGKIYRFKNKILKT